MKHNELSPEDVIAAMNRAYHSMRESSNRESADAAQKGFNTCRAWLRARKVPFHQNAKGEWVLSEDKTV